MSSRRRPAVLASPGRVSLRRGLRCPRAVTWGVRMKIVRLAALAAVVFLAADPAFAHHLMGGRMPATFAEGLLSGLGHPVIGIDHFAAVVAVGCLAAAHRAGALLAIAFVVAMMTGVAIH